MCMDARVLLTKGFDWIDKSLSCLLLVAGLILLSCVRDLSGELTAPDLHEFAIAMYPADPDPDKTVQPLRFNVTNIQYDESIRRINTMNQYDESIR